MIRGDIVSKNKNFIGCWKIDNVKLFSGIIDFFENNDQLHKKGIVTAGTNNVIKKTTDFEKILIVFL